MPVNLGETISHEASVVELGGGGESERSEVSLRPSEARELTPGGFGGGGL